MANLAPQANEVVHAFVVAGGSVEELTACLDGVAENTRQPLLVVVALLESGPAPRVVGTLLKERFGDRGRVVSIGTAPNFGAAIRTAQTSDAVTGVSKPDWLWLLHDDAVAARDALAQLMAQVNQAQGVAVVGPKQVQWDDPERVLEVGIEATRGGRRVQLASSDEIDQGQYDDRHDVLAVGSAGMLVRFDVWERLRGFDPALGPFGDGLEFGRRVRRAGYRVVVAPGAVIAHRQQSLAPGGDQVASFRPRRTAQLYVGIVAMVPVLPFFAVLGLFIWTPLRALWAGLTRRPQGFRSELGVGWDIFRYLPAIGRARRRTRKVARVPRRALRTVELSSADLRRRKRALRRADKVLTEVHQIDAAGRKLLGRYRSNYLLVLVSLLLIALIVSLVGWYRFIPGLAGGAWGNLPQQWGQLWASAWSNWVLAADGSPGPGNPLLPVLSVATLPFALLGISPSTSAIVFMVCALPLAVLGGWAVSGCFTRSLWVRAGVACVWAGQPAFVEALVTGNLGGTLAWVSLPLVVVGLWRATAVIAPTRIEGVADTALLRRCDPIMWGALAGFGAMVFLSTTPGLLPVLIVVAYLLALLPTATFFSESTLEQSQTLGGTQAPVLPLRASRSQRLAAATMAWVPAFILTIPTWFSNWFDSSGKTLPAPTWIPRLFAPTGATLQAATPLEVLTGGNGESVLGLISAGILAAGVVLALLVSVFTANGRPWLLRLSATLGTALLLGVVVLSVVSLEVLQLTGIYAAVAMCAVIALLALVSEVPLHPGGARVAQWRQRLGSLPLLSVGILGSIGVLLGLFGGALVPVAPPQIPLVAQQAQDGPRAARLLQVQVENDQVSAQLMRGLRTEQVDLSLGLQDAWSAVESARVDLAQTVGTLAANPSAAAVTSLANHAIDFVLVPASADPATPGQEQLIDNLDASAGMERIGTTDLGTMWRVRPGGIVPARVMIDDEGVPSGPLTVNTALHLNEDSVVYLSEVADPGWSARFNGEALEPLDDPGEWRAAFQIPAGEGTLSIRYRPVTTSIWAISVAVVAGLLLVLALPWRLRRNTWIVLPEKSRQSGRLEDEALAEDAVLAGDAGNLGSDGDESVEGTDVEAE